MNFYILFSIIWLYYCTAEVPYRSDYKYVDSLKAFYKVHKTKANFSTALATCNAEGSKLLVPASNYETTVLTLTLTTPNMDLFWEGIHDIYSEGEFVSVYGVPLEDIYIEWLQGEPNNAVYKDGSYDEDCVVFSTSSRSNDVPCNYEYYYICKKNLEGLIRNEACETFDPKYKFIPDLDRCYKFHNNSINWREAFKTCKSEESHLVIINTDLEADALVEMFSKYPENTLVGDFNKKIIHVGFNDLLISGTYLTIKGQPLSDAGYEKWAQSQPDNADGEKQCGSMFRDGLLYKSNCDDVNAMFVCEKELTEIHPRFGSSSA